MGPISCAFSRLYGAKGWAALGAVAGVLFVAFPLLNLVMPAFMVFLDWKEFPWQWWNSDQFWWAMLLVVLAPGLLAFVFGYFAFRSRVKGVYFSIITQALTYAAMLLFFRNATGFGGNNGFTDFKLIVGFPITTPGTRMALFAITAFTLLATLLLARWVVTSKF